MSKNLLKRGLSLLAVVFIMMTTMIPAFAKDDTCACNNEDLTTACVALCKTVGPDAEGQVKYSTDRSDTYPYAISITVGGQPTEYYIARRPDVNDMSVQMKNGKIEVYGMGTGDANTWNQFFAKYKTVIVGISGIGAITFIALFIFQFMKLGASAGNPQARSQALTGCLWTGIAAAALGAVSIIAGFFYNAV